MCFRLLVALRPAPPGEWTAEALEAWARECGLDVRTAPKGTLRFAEVAWGDCACSLYTKREGRERVVGFLEGLLSQHGRVELLLATDDEPLRPGLPVAAVTWEKVRVEGLQALPQGQVAALSR